MVFEFDIAKSKLNKIKHGIDFNEAQLIWNGVFVEFAAKSDYENRYTAIGSISRVLYTCIFTLRGSSIRIISCRSSRIKEKALYEKFI